MLPTVGYLNLVHVSTIYKGPLIWLMNIPVLIYINLHEHTDLETPQTQVTVVVVYTGPGSWIFKLALGKCGIVLQRHC